MATMVEEVLQPPVTVSRDALAPSGRVLAFLPVSPPARRTGALWAWMELEHLEHRLLHTSAPDHPPLGRAGRMHHTADIQLTGTQNINWL